MASKITIDEILTSNNFYSYKETFTIPQNQFFTYILYNNVQNTNHTQPDM